MCMHMGFFKLHFYIGFLIGIFFIFKDFLKVRINKTIMIEDFAFSSIENIFEFSYNSDQ